MMRTATTLCGWVIAISRALEEYDVKSEPLFEQAGIDLETARDPNSRFEVTRTSRLFQLAQEASGDPAFGLMVGRMMRPTSWHALGFSIWAGNNIREGLYRVVKYSKVFTNCAYGGCEEFEDRIRIWGKAYPTYEPILSDAQYEAFIATVVLTCRHIFPGRFRPLRIGLPRKMPLMDMGSFDRMFKCPIEFDQDTVWLEIDSQIADTPLPTANSELAQKNDQICAEYIARFDRTDIVNQVYYRLLEVLPEGEPDMETMAQTMNLSTRTLQRKLKERGSSYKQLLDNVRKELALLYIRQSHVPIAEISYRLGFSHVSNFSRAFKRWTGKAPAECRNQLEQGQGEQEVIQDLTHDLSRNLTAAP
ncbi:AraC family transcriptional regulator [Oceanospirillum sediminis]|uniref:AraC family transcriptional regulator n=1 Tax=Oceanospirillum sediminis TaxID=2760088 RepID=A0A839ITW5_9GAMM|nr:AraC family transcriptional regulator [Oceanospirillum sediminis]MBB1487556.1 AraC family transcriptional regulator [Oceanospirillum sediminis]